MTLCLLIHRPHSPGEVGDTFFFCPFITAAESSSVAVQWYITNLRVSVCASCRGTALGLRLSLPVGPGFTPASPIGHHLSQPGLPAWSHPCRHRARISETVTAAEVSRCEHMINEPRSYFECVFFQMCWLMTLVLFMSMDAAKKKCCVLLLRAFKKNADSCQESEALHPKVILSQTFCDTGSLNPRKKYWFTWYVERVNANKYLFCRKKLKNCMWAKKNDV